LAGATIPPYIADPKELQLRVADVVRAIEEGWLNIGAGTSYPLTHAAKAHQDIESRQTQGKLYLVPRVS
jgi:NADPH:quinone reductase